VKYLTSVKIEDLTICIESNLIMEGGREGIRESYGQD
jgi:hypothetical protein